MFTLLPDDPAAPAPAVSALPVSEEEEKQRKEVEYRAVKELMDSYDAARKFDKAARRQYAKDRRYASGTADISWAVSANLIGSFIDILSSFLYARNPDVSARKAESVDQAPNADMQAFSKTIELVVARLWKRARLKHAIKKMVRSALSCGPGWIKVVMITDRVNDPQVEAAINDASDNLQRLRASQEALAADAVKDRELAMADIERQIQGLNAKLEVSVFRGLAIDFCSAEDIQVSLDVRDLDDYLEAGWIANAIYRPKSELGAMFPRLTPDQIKEAIPYHQRKPHDNDANYSGGREVTDADADAFGKEGAVGVDGDPIEFAKILEFWDRRDNSIKTVVDGVKCWAKEPYPPPQASTRFFPYFYLAFYEVDGARHPQSLSWRLRKLMDEYSATRSAGRVNRQRSVPGVLFNAEALDEDNARKLERGVDQEYIGLKLTNPNMPMRDVFSEKPVARMDPMVFDTSAVLSDMEKIAGVQEALQSSVVQPKTATEAEIQQSGFAARTSADRDAEEDMLSELAQYTAELAIQTLSTRDAQRIAGPAAFWPQGMDVEDLLTMVEVDISAGSTGKPNTSAEREAWGVVMPMIQQLMLQIQQFRATGNEPLAKAMTELLRETLNRMGDRIDVDRFLPEAAMPPVLPGMPGQPPPGGAPMPPPVPGEPAPGPPPPGVPPAAMAA